MFAIGGNVILPKYQNRKYEPLDIVYSKQNEAQLIAQSIGQAFQVAYIEFLTSNGIKDLGLLKDMDYQDVLDQQEIYGEELNLFANKDFHKEASRPETVVKLTIVPCPPVVEVIIKRPDVKYQLGFSVQNGVICSLLRGGIAERGGVRVGHRIIEINNQSVVAVPHDKIVTLLANSIGEIHMKTMRTSIFRLLTGQDVPHYL
ncbi:hypothetical protein BsWGS_01466 [Bradybaena similaris]